ncbi:MAG TPA: hypothetical protein GX747_01830 [Tenericutes bacterium]|nr:hypothetical protein [Mycoplasmatota bacterium]
MNKKGFTLVELLSSIVFVSLIAFVLIEIVMSLKNLYDTSGLKTELLNKQGIISNKINSTLLTNSVVLVQRCGNECIDFTMSDNSVIKLEIDIKNNIISFGDYKTELNQNSQFGQIRINNILSTFSHPTKFDGILNIKIPIKSNNFEDKDFGINIVYQYNSNYTTINID